MSKKSALRILVSAVLLVAVLIVVPILAVKTESAPMPLDAATEERLAGSDNILLHPPVPLSPNYYFGSDWIERHPSNYYIGADWIERHPPTPVPANYYTGSDWIERHPCQPNQ